MVTKRHGYQVTSVSMGAIHIALNSTRPPTPNPHPATPTPTHTYTHTHPHPQDVTWLSVGYHVTW